MNPTRYVGESATDNTMVGDVYSIHDGEKCLLDMRLDLRNHSPTGFAWGYLGSGPAQLALAILADYAGDDIAKRAYQPFKAEFIAALPPGSWKIEGEAIGKWLADNGIELETANVE